MMSGQSRPRRWRSSRRWPTSVGIGITRIGEGYGLKVNLRTAAGKGVELPDKVDGVPVKVEVVGRLTKQ